MSRLITIMAADVALAAASFTPLQAMPVQVDRGADASTILVAGGCGPYAHRGPYGGCRPNGGWRRGWHRGWGPGYHRRGWGPGWERRRQWHRRYVY